MLSKIFVSNEQTSNAHEEGDLYKVVTTFVMPDTNADILINIGNDGYIPV